MKLYNSLTRKKEEFQPFRKGKKVGVYTCGPTVYDTAHIGNFRTYTMADVLVRSLRFVGYQVTYVMNLTDVGHLTGDNEGDADKGEDRMEKGAKREGLTAWQIADKYGREFEQHMGWLNLVRPDYLVKATAHIKEQIALVQELEKKGLTYKTSDGLYFDVQEFEKRGYKYGQLSNLQKIKEGARVAVNPSKKDPRDFALWKFSPQNVKRQMEWESPWGVGFPGWHIECSAMSMKYLGPQFEVHVGGEDLMSTHHPNEIAQSEGATGKSPFVKYWMHVRFLLVDGGRMGKSLGNAYNLNDVVKNGYSPLALRYFYLTGHYRKQANFTWEALESGERSWRRLRNVYEEWRGEKEEGVGEEYVSKFKEMIEDDLDTPRALGVMWEMVRDEKLGGGDKRRILRKMDEVLGLKVADGCKEQVEEKVRQLAEKRAELRKQKKYEEADAIREQLRKMGYEIRDEEEGWKLVKVGR